MWVYVLCTHNKSEKHAYDLKDERTQKKKKTALIREALSWPRKTEQNIIANFATKFGSGRVILFPLLANPETEPELCVL